MTDDFDLLAICEVCPETRKNSRSGHSQLSTSINLFYSYSVLTSAYRKMPNYDYPYR
jgi:hypothetical protein